MQTRIALLALLSALGTAALAQVPASTAVMRVDAATQRQRDQSRVGILQDELVTEALGLAEARKRAREADADPRAAQEAARRIAQHRQNISALARELATVERQTNAAAAKAPGVPVTPQRVAEEWFSGDSVRPKQPSVDQRRTGTPEWFIPATPGANPK